MGAAIPVNADRVGHRYPSYTYEVSLEKVREYAAATGVDDPVYSADPAGLAGREVLAPPTFAACMTLARGGPFADDDLGLGPRLIHGRQSFTFHRPLRVGDLIECTPWILDVAQRGGMGVVTVQTDCVDLPDRQPVLSSRMMLVVPPEGD